MKIQHPEHQYLDTLAEILINGEEVPNRTGVNTKRILGVQHRYDFEEWGFPLLTTKRVWMKGVIVEMLWFLSGSQNIKFMVNEGVNIWVDDAYRTFKQIFPNALLDKETFVEHVKAGVTEDKGRGETYTYGDLGPVYGTQWRNWKYEDEGTKRVDQISKLVYNLKNNPGSRRHILSAWNVPQVDQMSLPPCHVMSQYTITNDGKLWCHMYQRSCDMFLGVPFNIASYSLLTYMLAQVCGLKPGGFIHTMHDTHIYMNHIDQVKEQLERYPREFPQLQLSPGIENMDSWLLPDITVEGYNPYPKIKAQLNAG